MGKQVEDGFETAHLENLKQFLYEAQLKGYGGEQYRGKIVSELMDDRGTLKREYETGVTEYVYADGGFKIIWKKGDFRFSDKWFGGEPFGGMTVVRYKGKTCFTMSYHGELKDYATDPELVYSCLKEALMAVDPSLPIRGPGEYVKSGAMDRTVDLEYRRILDGWLGKFSGSESIGVPLGEILFEADFIGGLVNLRDPLA